LVSKFSVEKLRGIKSTKDLTKKLKGVELPEIIGSRWIIPESSEIARNWLRKEMKISE